ncbi:MAG: type II secretion system F family protein [Phycisphaerales bacterium JB043]
MPRYAYEARDGLGSQTSGVIEAPSEHDAARMLRDESLSVTSIRIATKINFEAGATSSRSMQRGVKREEVISFTSQMAVMLETGVPLAEALEAVVTQLKPGNFKNVLITVTDRITSGLSFSVAIAEFPHVFPNMMVSLLEASEAAGSLASMLHRVSEYLANERQTRRQIRGALTYPAIMLSMCLGVTSFLIIWVLPRFAGIYEARSAVLPAPTQMLLDASTWVITNGWALAGGIVGVAVLAVWYRNTRSGRELFDTLKLRVPVIGPIFTNFYLTRVTRTLATLLASGVTLPEAIRILRGLITNTHWETLWDDMDEAITSGKTIGEVVLQTRNIPPSLGQMIAAGERSGKLPEVLERVANVTEKDFEESVKTGTQLIEPIMIILMGVMIGGVAVALLLPIFTMGSMMSQ